MKTLINLIQLTLVILIAAQLYTKEYEAATVNAIMFVGWSIQELRINKKNNE